MAQRDILLKTIVVPVDRSASSFRAVPIATALAQASGARVELVGVATDGCDPVGPLLERLGEPSTALCLATVDPPSIASQVAERAVRPFLAVGPNVDAGALGDDVVVAIDTQHDADRLLWPAARWAVALDAPLRIVTVLEPAVSSASRARLQRERGRLRRIGLHRVDIVAVEDGPGVAAALIEHLSLAPALLLVAGGRRGTMQAWPDVLRELVSTVASPILVIPTAANFRDPSRSASNELTFSP